MGAVIADLVWPNRLRDLRKARGEAEGRRIFIEEVAAACDCSIGYLSRVEKGFIRPSEPLMAALAAYYAVPTDSLALAGGMSRFGDANVIGAYVRHRRQAMGTSMATLAQRVEAASGASVSYSLMRNIESGKRVFLSDDRITAALIDVLQIDSLEALRRQAREAFEGGELAEVIEELRGEPVGQLSDVPLYADGRPDRLALPMPAVLLDRVSKPHREFAVRLDRGVMGTAAPAGAYFIARPGTAPRPGGFAILWSGDEPLIVRVVDDREKGVFGVRDRPRLQTPLAGARADAVMAIVLPD